MLLFTLVLLLGLLPLPGAPFEAGEPESEPQSGLQCFEFDSKWQWWPPQNAEVLPPPTILRSSWPYTPGGKVALTCAVRKPAANDTATLMLYVNDEKITEEKGDEQLGLCVNQDTGVKYLQFSFDPDNYRYRGNRVRATCWAAYRDYAVSDSVEMLTYTKDNGKSSVEVRDPLDQFTPYGSAATAAAGSVSLLVTLLLVQRMSAHLTW